MNKDNELMCVVTKYTLKCYNHIYVYHLGYIHLSPITPPASTSGETLSDSQVLPKGLVIRVLLVYY